MPLRSQRTKNDDVYLEMSLFDLKEKYNGTAEGRLWGITFEQQNMCNMSSFALENFH